MKTIWKYKLKRDDSQVLRLPKGSKLLTVQLENEVVCIWALVDPNEKDIESRLIKMYGDGHDIVYSNGHDIDIENLMYIGSVQVYDGHLMLHIFEVAEKWQGD